MQLACSRTICRMQLLHSENSPKTSDEALRKTQQSKWLRYMHAFVLISIMCFETVGYWCKPLQNEILLLIKFLAHKGLLSESEDLMPPKVPVDTRVFKPPVCQTSKTDYYSIAFENDQYLYCCSQCDFKTPVRATIYTHKYRHEEKAYGCGYCDFVSAPRYALLLQNSSPALFAISLSLQISIELIL